MSIKLKRLFLICFSIIIALSSYGCSKHSSKAESAPFDNSIVAQDGALSKPQEAAGEMTVEKGSRGSYADTEATMPENGFNSNMNKSNAKIIRSANIIIETKSYDQCIDSILRDVKSFGGYPENIIKEGRGLYANSKIRSAELVVRIPSNFFDTFIERTDEFGNVISESITGENISDQYADIEARIKVLRIRQERLMALMEESASLEYLFEVEKELANVGYEIETLTGALNKYDNLVDYSTITISIQEVEEFKEVIPDDSFGEKIRSSFNTSLNSIITLFKGLIILFAALIPYLILIAFVTLIVSIVFKWAKMRNRKEKVKKTEEHAEGPEDKN